MTACERFTRRAQPCPDAALYEVDVPSPTLYERLAGMS